MHWDNGVDAVALNNFLLNDRLGDVMDMVVNILVNALAKVNNGPFFAAVYFGVLVLSSERSEECNIFGGGSVLLVDLGRGNQIFVDFFGKDLFV